MAKYDQQFKLALVQRYLSGEGGYDALCKRDGVADSMLKGWVVSYRIHGAVGLAKRRNVRYSAEFKRQVLNQIRAEGLSDNQAIARYDLRNSGVIGQWRAQHDSGGLAALEPRPRGRPSMPHKKPPAPPPKDTTVEQLIQENAYLRAELDYLKKLDALVQAEKTAALVKKRKWSES